MGKTKTELDPDVILGADVAVDFEPAGAACGAAASIIFD
jgi:hypothetical protein